MYAVHITDMLNQEQKHIKKRLLKEIVSFLLEETGLVFSGKLMAKSLRNGNGKHCWSIRDFDFNLEIIAA